METIPQELLTPRSKTDFNDPFFSDPIWNVFDTEVGVYFLCLAAVQRGLEVTLWGNTDIAKNTMWRNQKSTNMRLFSVTNGKRTHFFDLTQGDLTSKEAGNVAKDKEATRALLKKNGVETPSGMLVTGRNTNKVKKFLSESPSSRFITKPQAGSLSKSVGRNMTPERVLRLINRTKDAQFILEEQIEGEEFRVYVVGDRVASGFRRNAPAVIGNGKDSIAQLINQKNKNRASRPHWSNRQVDIAPIAAWLAKSGISVHSVPVFGKKVIISPDMNVRRGANYEDVTFTMPRIAAETAIAASLALGLPNSGMDLIVRDGVAYILEVNTRAQIQMHAVQEFGKHLDNSAPEAIIDAYFPSNEPIERDIDIGVDTKKIKEAFERDGFETAHKIVPIRRDETTH